MVSSEKIIEQRAIVKGIKVSDVLLREIFVEIFQLECLSLWIFHTHTLS